MGKDKRVAGERERGWNGLNDWNVWNGVAVG